MGLGTCSRTTIIVFMFQVLYVSCQSEGISNSTLLTVSPSIALSKDDLDKISILSSLSKTNFSETGNLTVVPNIVAQNSPPRSDWLNPAPGDLGINSTEALKNTTVPNRRLALTVLGSCQCAGCTSTVSVGAKSLVTLTFTLSNRIAFGFQDTVSLTSMSSSFEECVTRPILSRLHVFLVRGSVHQ